MESVEPRTAKLGVFRGGSDLVKTIKLARDHGVLSAFMKVRSVVLHRLHSAWLERRLVPLDHAESSSEVSLSETTTIGSNRSNGVDYVPTPSHIFERLLSELPIEPGNFSFVDLGCGRGRMLSLAAELGFRDIAGVEFAVEFAEHARERIAQYKAISGTQAKLRCHTMDVVDFVAPDQPLIVFLFNPFGAPVLDSVIRNLERSHNKSPRKIHVIYFNPAHARLFDRSHLFERRPLSLALRAYLALLSPYGAALYESCS